MHPWAGQRLVKLEGTKQGLWSVLQYLRSCKKSGKPRHIYLCKCDCGTEREVKSNGGKLFSTCCGCYKPNKHKSLKPRSINPNKLDIYHNLRARYKRDAIKRGYEYSITKEEFKSLVTSDCYYCGIDYKNSNKSIYNDFWEVRYNGIDRVDNTKGYTTENCVSCCKNCNFEKKTVTPNIIKKAYNFLFGDKK